MKRTHRRHWSQQELVVHRGGDAGARGGSAAREQRWGAPGGAGPGGRPWHRARRPCGGQGPGEAKLTHTQVTELGPRPVKAPL